MELPPGIRPDERLLILGIPEPGEVATLASALSNGLVVLMAEGEDVYSARKAARDLDNVMVVPGTPDELPWRDGFFTRVIDMVDNWPDSDKVRREIERVTAVRAEET